MGIAANQARLLSITARLADVEYQTEALTASKLRLATQSSQEATNYTNNLNDIEAQRQAFLDGSIWDSMPIEFAYLNSAEYGVEGKSANEWKLLANTTQTSDENYATYNTNYNNAMEKAQRAYQRDMAAWNAAQNTAEYDALKREAEMDHEVVLQDIKNKEAAIDMKINPLQAEHEALKTERDSLKSLIKDNTDKSFNLFS